MDHSDMSHQLLAIKENVCDLEQLNWNYGKFERAETTRNMITSCLQKSVVQDKESQI